MQTNEARKDVVLSIVAAFASIVIYHAANAAIKSVIADDFLSTFLAEVVFAALAIASVLLLKQTALFHSDPAHLKTGWMSAGALFALMIFYGTGALVNAIESTATTSQWLLFIGQVILVGVAEELLFRGLVQRAFHRFFGEDSVAHVLLAVFFSGLVFGLAHLINIDRGNGPLVAVFQACVNVFMGMYYCGIYFRTGKNIWYLIGIHALYDIIGMVGNGRMNGMTVNEALNTATNAPMTIGSVFVAALVFGAIYGVITLLILRPKKVKPLLSRSELR